MESIVAFAAEIAADEERKKLEAKQKELQARKAEIAQQMAAEAHASGSLCDSNQSAEPLTSGRDQPASGSACDANPSAASSPGSGPGDIQPDPSATAASSTMTWLSQLTPTHTIAPGSATLTRLPP